MLETYQWVRTYLSPCAPSNLCILLSCFISICSSVAVVDLHSFRTSFFPSFTCSLIPFQHSHPLYCIPPISLLYYGRIFKHEYALSFPCIFNTAYTLCYFVIQRNHRLLDESCSSFIHCISTPLLLSVVSCITDPEVTTSRSKGGFKSISPAVSDSQLLGRLLIGKKKK